MRNWQITSALSNFAWSWRDWQSWRVVGRRPRIARWKGGFHLLLNLQQACQMKQTAALRVQISCFQRWETISPGPVWVMRLLKPGPLCFIISVADIQWKHQKQRADRNCSSWIIYCLYFLGLSRKWETRNKLHAHDGKLGQKVEMCKGR